jgi:hypothetical protein
MTDVRRFVAVLIVSRVVGAGSLAAAGKLRARHVFVHVLDQHGTPVGGLTAADFQPAEGGVARVTSHGAAA